MTNPTQRPALHHDGELLIATGRSRLETRWRSQSLAWSDLLARLAQPTRTADTMAEYDGMTKAQQLERKDVGGYVGGALKAGRRTAQNLQSRQLIALDMDHGDLSALDAWLAWSGCAWAMHSTRKDRPGRPRVRLLLPVSRPLLPDEYQAVARRIAADIGIDLWDDTTFEPHRMMYWPSVSQDQDYTFRHSDDPWLEPDPVLARLGDWRDQRNWPTSSRMRADLQQRANRAGEPTEKPGLIGAFCRLYGVHAAIAEFLADTYTPAGQDRYTYAAGTSAGGVVVYEDKWVYSHHGTDPISGELCNAWDLLRLHRFGQLDHDTDESVPLAKRPSSAAMAEWAGQLPAMRRHLAAESLRSAGADFADVVPGVSSVHTLEIVPGEPGGDALAWADKLTRNRHGGLEPTRENLRRVLEHDPRLAGRLRHDDFASRPTTQGPVPWNADAGLREWRDVDDAGLRHYVETHWGVNAPGPLQDALALVQASHSYHPVRQYLDGLTWDGVPRLDTLLVRYLGAEDNDYTRAVTRKTMAAAVARVREPGCKFDYMLTLFGEQGTGKSSLAGALGGPWASDSLVTVQGKEAFEALQGVWVVEMAELTATRQADVEAVKHFLSKRSDRFRGAYMRRTETHPRQCVFIGSTNNPEFLTDPTGARRFWVLPVHGTGRQPWEWMPEMVAERDQLWAEAVVRYAEGEPLYLTGAVAAHAVKVQEEHRAEDGMVGVIEQWLATPVPEGWREWTVDRRMRAVAGGFSDPADGAPAELRDRVCAREVWVECLGHRSETFTRGKAIEVNNALRKLGWTPTSGADFGPYGRGRGFWRPAPF